MVDWGAFKLGKYGRTGTGSCRSVPLSHETYGRPGTPAFALLHELIESTASTAAISRNLFMQNAAREFCATLCRGITGQVLASALLRARMDVRPVLPGRPYSHRWPSVLSLLHLSWPLSPPRLSWPRHLFAFPLHSLSLPPIRSSPLPPSKPAPPHPPQRLAVRQCLITNST